MRLLTRSDFDGICCAVLLKELGMMDEMVYAHPKDLQDGKIPVTENTSRAEAMFRLAEKEYSNARQIDAQQDTPGAIEDFSLINARNS